MLHFFYSTRMQLMKIISIIIFEKFITLTKLWIKKFWGKKKTPRVIRAFFRENKNLHDENTSVHYSKLYSKDIFLKPVRYNVLMDKIAA